MYSQSRRSVSTLMATKTKVLMTAPTAFIISTKNHPTDYHQREQPARNKEKSWSCGRCGPDCKPVAWNRSQSGVRSNQTFVVLSLCGRSGEGGYPCCGQYGSFHVFGSLTKSPEKVERDSCLQPPWENAGGPPHQHGGKNVFFFNSQLLLQVLTLVNSTTIFPPCPTSWILSPSLMAFEKGVV